MPRGESVPVMITTLSLSRLPCPSAHASLRDWQGGDVRSRGVPRYAADFGYVFEGAGVGGLDDELLAEGLEAGFGDGGHAGVFEGVEELLVLVRRHCWRRRGGEGSESCGDVESRGGRALGAKTLEVQQNHGDCHSNG